RLRSLAAESSDVVEAVRRYRESAEADPARLDQIQGRLAAIRGLERKYGEGVEGVLRYLEETRERLAGLEGSEGERERLASAHERLEADAARRAITIRLERAAAGSALAGALEVELWDLGMGGASVGVELHEVELGPDGADRVEILLAPGPGQRRLPLRKAASGGELSRTMLACRSVLADLDDVPTVVFDEVDAGIGGRAGVAVGRRLARIARTRQVLVVTHLPQIASFADAHLTVEKRDGTATVRALDESGKVRELSRMLAGLPSSDAASTHAEELLAEAAKEKGR
ncbi:MAG: DNA repair protein RecN, partial [Actinobacteria bacterium]|nr:DNA repair protein RecN [Actinomycetota bacterium]